METTKAFKILHDHAHASAKLCVTFDVRARAAKDVVDALEVIGKLVDREVAFEQANNNDSALKAHAEEFAKTLHCTCDLDNWSPERSTGHSIVCCIHKAAIAAHYS